MSEENRKNPIEESGTGSKIRKSTVHLTIPLVIIFVLMTIMVIYTSNVIRKVAVGNINEVGEDRLSGVAAQIENYLETTKSVLWVTADTVDLMTKTGATTDEILQYITEESAKQEQHFDENYTGIYGYVMGEYLDGVAWVPYEGYDATERDWYKAAIAANGESTIVSPYVDAQTNAVIISISRMLSNGRDVLSLDLTMNYIQDLASELQIKGKGYGYIFNQDGLIIAHPDESMKGKFLTEDEDSRILMEKAMEVKDGNFTIHEDGKRSTVFVKQIMDQWYAVIIISNAELYAEVVQQLWVNVIICVVIFALIALFYYVGYRNEQRYSRRIDEMRAEEQRQAYEAKALKIEKEAADASNQAKSDFLAQMSHEIRTPINAVIGMDEMILRETTEPNIIEYARDIKSASQTLLALVNGVLDFSKIESGKMEILPAKYKTEELINHLVNMISDRAEKKHLEFNLDIDQNLPTVLYGDDVRIKQVITNLLTNAVKYTEKGSVTLTVRAEDVSEKDCMLYVEVKDTGIGIRSEDMDRMFESFQRLDVKKNRNIEGTGLGMPIVVGILSMMNSKVEVESEYGKGSAFSFRIHQGIVDAKPLGEYHGSHGLGSDLREKRTLRILNAAILVVDDNIMNLKVAKGLMKKLNVVPDLAESGEDAMEMVRKKHYDLIFMDHMMPEMDGIETLKKMKEERIIDKNTPVIALTANAIAGAREMYMEKGFWDYLSKPIAPEEMEEVIAWYLPEGSYTYEENEEKNDNSELVRLLRQMGFDVDAAMGYVMEDVDFYEELLKTFAENEPGNGKEIRTHYENKNWDDYKTLVHALKSSARTIGANHLSDLALEQENASKARNESSIEAGVEGLLTEYRKIAGEVKDVLSKVASDTGSSSDEDDLEIMDFYPGS